MINCLASELEMVCLKTNYLTQIPEAVKDWTLKNPCVIVLDIKHERFDNKYCILITYKKIYLFDSVEDKTEKSEAFLNEMIQGTKPSHSSSPYNIQDPLSVTRSNEKIQGSDSFTDNEHLNKVIGKYGKSIDSTDIEREAQIDLTNERVRDINDSFNNRSKGRAPGQK